MTDSADAIIGWDIGGAHVKLARLSSRGVLTTVEQHVCTLWKGVGHLEDVLRAINGSIPLDRCAHAVTMTGEMVDLFRQRRQGVQAIIAAMERHTGTAPLWVYAQDLGLVAAAAAHRHADAIASANWRACADLVATRLPDAVLMDIGSTTTDIIPIASGRVASRGRTDGERLRHDELVYSGVVRTPLMALADRLSFLGRSQRIAAEWFAGTGDVYLLTGQLSRRHYRAGTSDGAGLGMRDCARRLARMLGRELEEASLAQWQAVARQVATRHRNQLGEALQRVVSRRRGGGKRPLVGAGCGRFIARQLATRLELPYIDFGEFANAPQRLRDMASVCAPAVAVARLAQHS
jgi:(4-(4-[2-(gamma-L-glutamylamino)ethyl]phenoxymethyl)furan-2-yl)methanamine synthase